jgi:hypothetical protein
LDTVDPLNSFSFPDFFSSWKSVRRADEVFLLPLGWLHLCLPHCSRRIQSNNTFTILFFPVNLCVSSEWATILRRKL